MSINRKKLAIPHMALTVLFEGPDFCGKSLQVKLLAEKLKSSNIPYALLREPGQTEIGEKIRAVLLDIANYDLDPVAELLLYNASRGIIHKTGC